MYLVIEFHGGYNYAHVVSNEEGNNMTFTSYEAAADYCRENLQDGRPVEIPFPWSCM